MRLTRDKYYELLRNALNQYIRYRNAYPREAHIVLVASPSVLAAISTYGDGGHVDLNGAITRYSLYGRDVYPLEGCDGLDVLVPALAWNATAVQLSTDTFPSVGDLLIDDGLLYVYTDEHTYHPTAYTVTNRINMEGHMITINADSISSSCVTMPYEQLRGMWPVPAWVSNMGDAAMRKKAHAEKELDPGDTKAIDDYLNSFAPQTMMSGA